MEDMKQYGYCRISTSRQNIERQVRNIQSAFPQAVIIKETYTGTKFQGRKELEKLLNKVQAKDVIVFDSVSRMSRNAEEGFEVYEELFYRGISLVFLKEPHINTDTYKKAMANQISMTGDKVDLILEGVNKYLMELAKEQELFLQEAFKKDVSGKYVNEGALYLVFLLLTGMRVGELLALKWESADLGNGFVEISSSRSMARNRGEGGSKYVMQEGTTKNSKARKIKLSAEALEVLLEIRNLALMKRAGLSHKGGLHILRRTFATNCYRNGGRTKQIAAYIGDLPSTAEKYYIAARDRVDIGGVEEAVVMLPDGKQKI